MSLPSGKRSEEEEYVRSAVWDEFLDMFVYPLITLLVLLALLYAIIYRPFIYFIKYPGYTTAWICAFVLLLWFVTWAVNGFPGLKSFSLTTIGHALLFVIIIYGFSILYYAVGVTLKDAFFWVNRPSPGHPLSTPIVVVSTLALGALLFFFRLNLRAFYGLTEIIVGVILATTRAASEEEASLQDPIFYLTFLTAGIYLVVRGLDNMREGLFGDDKVRDPWACRIYQRVNPIFEEWFLQRVKPIFEKWFQKILKKIELRLRQQRGFLPANVERTPATTDPTEDQISP